MFGSKRLRRIEVVGTKTAKGRKPKPATDSSPIPTKLTAVGLGMTKPVANSKVVKIDLLTSSKYVIGSQALACVLQVFDAYAVVSLPGGVTGTIGIEEVSDYFHSISLETANKRKLKVLTLSVFQNISELTFRFNAIHFDLIETAS